MHISIADLCKEWHGMISEACRWSHCRDTRTPEHPVHPSPGYSDIRASHTRHRDTRPPEHPTQNAHMHMPATIHPHLRHHDRRTSLDRTTAINPITTIVLYQPHPPPFQQLHAHRASFSRRDEFMATTQGSRHQA